VVALAWFVIVPLGTRYYSSRGRRLAAGVEITADFELDVPMPFDTDRMAVTIGILRLHASQQISIVQQRA
jgi:hypothetical protein